MTAWATWSLRTSKNLCAGNRCIRDSRSSPTEHHEPGVPDGFFCLRNSSIAQVILEVTRDSEVTWPRVQNARVRNSPKTWERDTAQPVIGARSRYCLCDRDRKNWPLATSLMFARSSSWRELWPQEYKLQKWAYDRDIAKSRMRVKMTWSRKFSTSEVMGAHRQSINRPLIDSLFKRVPF